ncbi:hypothetical protein [Sphingobium olei]|uniref:Transposase n=1 Tax=Sphingobium olei TaxID=420955 RepID=A0ABW3NTP0_9SPHN|nr:hypothetical protein [Sphingobium sp.]
MPYATRIRRRPYSADELRAMFAEGDSVSQVANRAYRLDRSMTKDRVRAILFDGAPA